MLLVETKGKDSGVEGEVKSRASRAGGEVGIFRIIFVKQSVTENGSARLMPVRFFFSAFCCVWLVGLANCSCVVGRRRNGFVLCSVFLVFHLSGGDVGRGGRGRRRTSCWPFQGLHVTAATWDRTLSGCCAKVVATLDRKM